jgi:selenoprotein W-related protein
VKHALGVEVRLVVGPAGSFEVAVDGKVVAERHTSGFPSEDEIIDAVKTSQGA